MRGSRFATLFRVFMSCGLRGRTKLTTRYQIIYFRNMHHFGSIPIILTAKRSEEPEVNSTGLYLYSFCSKRIRLQPWSLWLHVPRIFDRKSLLYRQLICIEGVCYTSVAWVFRRQNRGWWFPFCCCKPYKRWVFRRQNRGRWFHHANPFAFAATICNYCG